jgi:hypothetical protein
MRVRRGPDMDTNREVEAFLEDPGRMPPIAI